MKRDELLDKLNATINAESLDDLEDAQEELKTAVKWLERLPAGCELVGLTRQVLNDEPVTSGLYDERCKIHDPDGYLDGSTIGNWEDSSAYESRFVAELRLPGPDIVIPLDPDDLTKAGKEEKE